MLHTIDTGSCPGTDIDGNGLVTGASTCG